MLKLIAHIICFLQPPLTYFIITSI